VLAEKDDLELLSEFEHHLRYVLRRSSHTVRAYRNDLSKFADFCRERNLSFTDITPLHIQQFLNSLSLQGLSVSTIHRVASSVKTFLRFLVQQGFAVHVPSHLHLPRPLKRLPRFLSYGEVNKIFSLSANDHITLRNKAVLASMYFGGLRVSEVCNLRLEDVWLGNGAHLSVRMGKGGKDRLVPLSSRAREAIEAYLRNRDAFVKNGDPGYLFLSVNGKKLDASAVYRLTRNLCQAAGIKLDGIHPHVFRHTFATHLLQKGVSVRVVQDLLGHSSLTTTSRYLHLGDAERFRAVSLLDE